MRPQSTNSASDGAPFAYGPILVGSLAALLAIRLVALHYNATDLFFDEAQYWTWSLQPAFGYYSKPPLIGWIIGLSTGACGDSAFCIRLPSAVIHTATAAILYAAGHRHLSPAAGFWAALMFATLPGVSVSAGIISTDVPLLFSWAVALLAFLELRAGGGWGAAIFLGIGLGLGLNAKYAMVFLPLSMVVAAVVDRPSRRLFSSARLWAGLVLGGALILPNLWWNLSNGFATFAHTADNAKWGGSLLNIGKGLEFIGAQFGVFGPILFAVLMATVWRAWREGLPEVEKVLLCFTLPILLLISAQGFVSRAHANWAATAYIAGSLLVASALLRHDGRRWLVASLVVHLVVMGALIAGTSAAGRMRLPIAGDPLHRMLGWKGIADATRQRLEAARKNGTPFASVVTTDRSLTAELLYYMRDEATPVLALRSDPVRPRDHYEMTRPFLGKAQEPALLVSLADVVAQGKLQGNFQRLEPAGTRDVPAGLFHNRRIHFFVLTGYAGRQATTDKDRSDP